MVLDIRQKQIDAVVRMLNLNVATPAHRPGAAPVLSASDEPMYKVLVLDSFTKEVIAPLLRVNDLRRHGITLHLQLENDRQPIPDVPAVYFVRGDEAAVAAVASDAAKGLYDAMHLNFTPPLSPQLLESLAKQLVASGSAHRVSKVFDQFLAFTAVEPQMFSLEHEGSYLTLNDPTSRDTAVEAAVSRVVDGLYAALVTLAVVPLIRCPKGGAAEAVAAQLEGRLRAALGARGNPFSEGEPAYGAPVAVGGRPLLALFDRTFELSVVLQHSWTYAPLVSDVLGLASNRVTIHAADAASSGTSSATTAPKSYEVGVGDPFWEANARRQFPAVAAAVDTMLKEYKASVEEINRKTGANVSADMAPNELMQQNTAGLMAAVSSLPQLTEKKRVADKHTNIASALMRIIKDRQLDQLHQVEEELLAGKASLPQISDLVQGGKGTAADKLRLVLVYLLTTESLPSEEQLRPIEDALREAGADDLPAVAYVRRMRRMNLAGGRTAAAAAAAAPAALAGSASSSGLAAFGLNWADKTFGSGLTSLTKGVKNLLAGDQLAAVTVAVEALMDAKPEADTFATFDPKAAPGRVPRQQGPCRDAIVFMIGGGNYLERESLDTWAGRAMPPKCVVYGATELLTGEAFTSQLAELGRRSGAT